MRRNKLLFIFAMLVAASARAAVGDTFTASTVEGVTMTFSVTDEGNKTCQVGSDFAECCISQDTRGALTIPQTANGYEVTAIAPFAFYQCEHLTSVTLPDGITVIGNDAFGYCGSLTSMNIPESVKTIGVDAFIRCGLLEIDIPAGVTTIEGNPFPNAPALRVAEGNLVFCSPEGSNAVIEKASRTLVAGCGGTVIPQDVTAIGPFAFNHCRLNAIVIPESVMEIGEYAFYSSYLESIEIPLGVTVLKANTFERCVALSSVTLHEGIGTVERNCFKDCKSLHSIALPQSLRTIGHNAFQGCQSLEEMIIPEGVEEIPAAAFVECGALRDVRLPESLKRIDDMAFFGCESLDSISLPSGLTELGRAVFGYGPLTAYRLFCETPPVVDETTFMGNYDARLYVPTGCAETYKNTVVWKNFKEIEEFDTNHITGIRIPVFQETIFDLQGRHLASPPNKGVYIQDGKKYVK